MEKVFEQTTFRLSYDKTAVLARQRSLAAIWLILPELMCSFQRLSHACVSVTCKTGKLRTAHYTSYNLLDLDFLLG